MPRVQLIATGEILSKADYCAMHPQVSFANDFAPLDDGELLPDLPVVPQVVTMRQARLALLGAGHLGVVQTAIAGAGEAAVIEWEYAQTVERAAGLVPQMASALGLTSEEIDALFTAAAAM